MAEATPEKPSDKRKLLENTKPSEKSDIQKGPEAIKKAKLDAKKERFAFMETLEAENSPKKSLNTPSQTIKEPPKTSGKFSSLASTEGNRVSGDEKKGVLEGIGQSLWAPLKAVANMVADAGRLVFSPRKETTRTLAYLEEANPDIQKI